MRGLRSDEPDVGGNIDRAGTVRMPGAGGGVEELVGGERVNEENTVCAHSTVTSVACVSVGLLLRQYKYRCASCGAEFFLSVAPDTEG